MNTNKTMCTSSLSMELSKDGNKIKSAGKNRQCTMQVKDITIDIMSKRRVCKFMLAIIANILLKCNNILFELYFFNN